MISSGWKPGMLLKLTLWGTGWPHHRGRTQLQMSTLPWLRNPGLNQQYWTKDLKIKDGQKRRIREIKNLNTGLYKATIWSIYYYSFMYFHVFMKC